MMAAEANRWITTLHEVWRWYGDWNYRDCITRMRQSTGGGSVIEAGVVFP
jgi:hypothetical protein